MTELLFEKSGYFIGIYDLREARFVRVNQAGVRILGFAPVVYLRGGDGRGKSPDTLTDFPYLFALN